MTSTRVISPPAPSALPEQTVLAAQLSPSVAAQVSAAQAAQEVISAVAEPPTLRAAPLARRPHGVTAAQSALPSPGPKEVVPVHAVHVLSAVAETTRRGVPSKLFPVQAERSETAAQSPDPSAGPKVVVPVHGVQVASAILVASTLRRAPVSPGPTFLTQAARAESA